MDIQSFITNWISVGNSYDTDAYLQLFCDDAVLDDPSVGRKFKGHKGIREYFTSYFIGYHTHTKLVKLVTKDNNKAYLEVKFTGTFPEGKIGGSFDLNFRDGKIAAVKANLL